MNNRDVNFIKRDLQTKGLVTYFQTQTPFIYAGWQLTNIGFELIRYEIEMEKKKRASNPFLGLLSNAPAISEIPAISTNYAISPKIRVGLLSEALRRKK